MLDDNEQQKMCASGQKMSQWTSGKTFPKQLDHREEKITYVLLCQLSETWLFFIYWHL